MRRTDRRTPVHDAARRYAARLRHGPLQRALRFHLHSQRFGGCCAPGHRGGQHPQLLRPGIQPGQRTSGSRYGARGPLRGDDSRPGDGIRMGEHAQRTVRRRGRGRHAPGLHDRHERLQRRCPRLLRPHRAQLLAQRWLRPDAERPVRCHAARPARRADPRQALRPLRRCGRRGTRRRGFLPRGDRRHGEFRDRRAGHHFLL